MVMRVKSIVPDNFKKISVKEFRDFGYLQEVNRLFLNPLGLAISVTSNAAGDEVLGSILDSRESLEGIVFAVDSCEELDDFKAKALRVQQEYAKRVETRREALGFAVQPLESSCKENV